MSKRKTYSGFTQKTAENLLLDAGAVFKNFDPTTDTFDTAVTAGKLIGATRNGSKFSAKPSVRQIQIDGVKGAAKGLEVIDEWTVELSTNLLEVTQKSVELALISAETDSSGTDYHEIKARNYILPSDYIENIAYLGKLSGSEKPIIIVVYNAVSLEGLSMEMKDKDEAVIPLTFRGHYDTTTLDNPPFAIYYPKSA